jgi:hypothetical protein
MKNFNLVHGFLICVYLIHVILAFYVSPSTFIFIPFLLLNVNKKEESHWNRWRGENISLFIFWSWKTNLGVNLFILERKVQYRWFYLSNMLEKIDHDLWFFFRIDLWFFKLFKWWFKNENGSIKVFNRVFKPDPVQG